LKKLLTVLFMFISFVYAIDTAMLMQMIKKDPALLDTPQGQRLLQESGLTKEQVLRVINNNSINSENQPPQIINKIDFNLTENNLSEFNETNMSEKNLTEINKTIITPLSYTEAYDIIQNIRKKQQIDKYEGLKRFGEKFFYNKNSINKTFLATPDYYQVNVGDIIKLEIFGANDKEMELKVDNNGNIVLPVLGPVHVASLSVSEVKELLKRKLKPTYPNSKIVVNVKINSFIQVVLSGYVLAPGVYNLNALSTIKDLLIAANGFGDIGSMRNVVLKRNGKVFKIIDFYKLIKNGDVVDTTILRNGDIVYVPKAKKLVELAGAVNVEAIYELKESEKLRDLIAYAGGLKPSASKKFIKITRYLNNSKTKVILTDLKDNISLKNGDKIYIYTISELNKDLVYVYGNIEKPGEYELPKDHKLSSLLKKLNYLKDTYYQYGLLERWNGKVVSFNLDNTAVKLKPKDVVYIFNKYEVLPNYYVSVEGDVVKRAGKLRYLKGMSLKDAIYNAGLISEFDKSKVKIVRYNKQMQPKTFFVNYEKNPDFKLNAFDEITLYKYTDFNPLKTIIVYGEVNKPSIYYYSPGMDLKDAINMAGGFTYKADKKYIELIRYNIKNNQRVRIIKKLAYQPDFKIMPYDEVFVKRIPNWDERKMVTIKGEVKYPGIYTIKTGEKLASIIKRAGGFTKDAYLYGAVFTRESIREMQEKRLKEMIYKLKKKVAIIAASAKGAGESTLNTKNLIEAIDSLAIQAEKLKPIGRIAIILDKNLTKFTKSPYNITLENNDTLYIPSKKDSVVVMGEVLTPTAFVYTKDSSIYYIKKAGGVTSLGEDVFFVVHANGFTEKGELGWGGDVEVKPGDVITVPIKIKTATWYGIAKDLTSIVYQLAITAASLKTVGAF